MTSALTNFIGRADFQAFTAGTAAAVAGYAIGTWTGAGAVGLAALGCLKWYQGYREAQEIAGAFRSLKHNDVTEFRRLSALLKSKLTIPYSYTLFREAIALRDALDKQMSWLQEMPTAVAVHSFSLLDTQDLGSLGAACTWTRAQVLKVYENRCRNMGIETARLPAGVNAKQFLLKQFKFIGVDFTKQSGNHTMRLVGEPGTFPPIPASIVQRADPNFRLVPLPTTIELHVPAGSKLILDEPTAVGDKKARLIEGDVAIEKPRVLQVPVTPNNILYLWRLLNPDQFEGLIQYAWQAVLDEHGDEGIDEPFWSYQRKDGIGFGLSYQQQVDLAGAQLKVLTLLERMWWHFLSNLQSGNIPQTAKIERLSTVTSGWQTGIWFVEAAGARFRLYLLGDDDDDDDVGVAVGLPPGSS